MKQSPLTLHISAFPALSTTWNLFSQDILENSFIKVSIHVYKQV